MSAFVVSNDHINVIVSYFITPTAGGQLWHELNGQYGYLTRDNASAVAQCLYSENVRSVNDRYDESDEDGFTFRYLPQARDLYSVGEIATALDCLEYQSCETRDYETTDAYKLLGAMRKRLLKDVAESEPDAENTWSISEAKQPIKRYL